jgi:hypothetical protein
MLSSEIITAGHVKLTKTPCGKLYAKAGCPELFCWQSRFDSKITTDPDMLAHMNVVRTDVGYPKLKLVSQI